MGSLMVLDGASATIFLGVLIALLLAAKYDNPAFQLGFVVAAGMAITAVILGKGSVDIAASIVVLVAAYVDERVNDLAWVERRGSVAARLLHQRPFLKVAILALCLAGALPSLLYFFAFLAFDFGYSLMEAYSVNRVGVANG